MDLYNIGQRSGASLVFTNSDKAEIRKVLLATEGIDAAVTSARQWNGLSRSESLNYGCDEKLTDSAVRVRRIAIKALPGAEMLLDRQRICLPVGSNLDLDWRWVAQHCDHTSVLVVENWEAFEGIHQVTFDLSKAGKNPLVVFRGSPVYRQDYVVSLLSALSLPVFAFVDYDPAGLVIAQSLPYFTGIIAPPMSLLETAITTAKNQDRYLGQLPQAQAVLNAATHPDIVEQWQLLKIHGKALPQEHFLLSLDKIVNR